MLIFRRYQNESIIIDGKIKVTVLNRSAGAGEARIWRIDRDANYGVLDELAANCVNTKRMIHHWDDMLRIAGSLKLGVIQASELVRSLLKSDRPSSLALAIIEAERINKTVYLLNFVDDEGYRRRILTQLNRTEKRHGLARVICHGRRGEIRKRYREGRGSTRCSGPDYQCRRSLEYNLHARRPGPPTT